MTIRASLVAVLMTAWANPSFAQTTIANWTFETSVPTTSGPLAPEAGAGSATAFHASAATAYSNPVGNGSAESWSSNNWSTGDYYQFQVSTVGQTGSLQFNWNQTRSGTGPSSFTLQYSTNGTSFTDFTTYSVPQVNWSGTTPDATNSTVFTSDLSAVTELLNQANVYFRLTSNETTAAAGTNRIDNIQVLIAPVPEPATVGLFAVAGLGLTRVVRRRAMG